MPFDVNRFKSETFRDRTEEVAVPELSSWFGPSEKPVFRVRGLSGLELSMVREAVQRMKSLETIATALAGSSGKEQLQAVRTALGLVETKSEDHVRRIHVLRHGLVEPALDRALVVKLCENHPIPAFRLSEKVLELTGMGRLGESTASGATPPSGQASPCAPGEDSEGADSGSSTK